MTFTPAKLIPAKAGSGNPRPRRGAPWATAGSVLPSAFTRTLDQHFSVNIEIVSRLTIENDTGSADKLTSGASRRSSHSAEGAEAAVYGDDDAVDEARGGAAEVDEGTDSSWGLPNRPEGV
jgi:hypothetical protein